MATSEGSNSRPHVGTFQPGQRERFAGSAPQQGLVGESHKNVRLRLASGHTTLRTGMTSDFGSQHMTGHAMDFYSTYWMFIWGGGLVLRRRAHHVAHHRATTFPAPHSIAPGSSRAASEPLKIRPPSNRSCVTSMQRRPSPGRRSAPPARFSAISSPRCSDTAAMLMIAVGAGPWWLRAFSGAEAPFRCPANPLPDAAA